MDSNSPDLCPLDYSLRNEVAQSMDWGNITTKATLIDEIKRSVLDFTVGLRLIQKNEGDYIR